MYVSTPAPLQLLVLYLQGERAKIQMPILAPRAFHLHAEAWDGEEGRVQTSSGIRGMGKLGRPVVLFHSAYKGLRVTSLLALGDM